MKRPHPFMAAGLFHGKFVHHQNRGAHSAPGALAVSVQVTEAAPARRNPAQELPWESKAVK